MSKYKKKYTKEAYTDLRTTYQPDYPLGAYIKRWARLHNITQKRINSGVGYSPTYSLYRLKSPSLDKFFSIVNYMAANSALSEEFYIVRLKAVIEGNYKWTR